MAHIAIRRCATSFRLGSRRLSRLSCGIGILILAVGTASAQQADVAIDLEPGLWIGTVSVTEVTDAEDRMTTAAGTFEFRVILHVDAKQKVRLLTDVVATLGKADDGTPTELLFADRKIIRRLGSQVRRTGRQTAVRYSAAAYDFDEGEEPGLVADMVAVSRLQAMGTYDDGSPIRLVTAAGRPVRDFDQFRQVYVCRTFWAALRQDGTLLSSATFLDGRNHIRRICGGTGRNIGLIRIDGRIDVLSGPELSFRLENRGGVEDAGIATGHGAAILNTREIFPWGTGFLHALPLAVAPTPPGNRFACTEDGIYVLDVERRLQFRRSATQTGGQDGGDETLPQIPGTPDEISLPIKTIAACEDRVALVTTSGQAWVWDPPNAPFRDTQVPVSDVRCGVNGIIWFNKDGEPLLPLKTPVVSDEFPPSWHTNPEIYEVFSSENPDSWSFAFDSSRGSAGSNGGSPTARSAAAGLIWFEPAGAKAAFRLKLSADHPTHPFRHKFHPDLRNLSDFDLQRDMSFMFTDSQETGSTKMVAGVYNETLTGVRKYPLKTRGSFRLFRVSEASELR